MGRECGVVSICLGAGILPPALLSSTFGKRRKADPKAKDKHWGFARNENRAKDLRILPEDEWSKR